MCIYKVEEEELEFYDLSALVKVIICTFSMHRGKKGETEFRYRETWNSTTAVLVLLRARGKAPIHGIAILRPHPSDDDGYEGYIQ